MQPFIYQSPTRVVYGEGTVFGIADILHDCAASKPLLITDKVLLEKGVIDPILETLKNAGFTDLLIYSDVPADSDVSCVRKAVEFVANKEIDILIAIGGGSVIDTAKVVNIGLSLSGDLLEFEGINNLPRRLKPLVAIPTTAGTGSEMSAVAMIKDRTDNKKLLFGSRYLYADVAILDPLLLKSLPPRLTAATGMDALTHCIESYVAQGSNPISDALCLEGLSMLFQNLYRATTCGEDLEARSSTLVASAMAGMAFTNAGVGVVHALAHTIGAYYGTHHGMTNSVFLPYGMQHNMESSYQKYARCWRHLCSLSPNSDGTEFGISAKLVSEADPHKDAQSFVRAVKELISACSLPVRLRDIGVPELTEDKLLELAAVAITDPASMFNPREVSLEDLVDLIKGAY